MPQLRIVLDTNTLFRALAAPDSASGKSLHACEERRAIPLLSKAILSEYWAVLTDPQIVASHPNITELTVKNSLDRLRYVGDSFRSVRARFSFPRDPRDAMYIALALEGNATHIITHDKDLLSLPTSRTDAGKRFRQRLPGVSVMQAVAFVRDEQSLFDLPQE